MALILLSLFISITLGCCGLFTEALWIFLHLHPARVTALAIDFAALIMAFIGTYFLYQARFKTEITIRKSWSFRIKAVSFSTSIYLLIALVSALITALYFVTIARQSPFGGWDAIAMYNSKARFIFHSSLPFELFSTRDYNLRYDCPLLLSGVIANFWAVCQSETYIIPIVINGLYLFSLAIFVAGLLSLHHHPVISLLGFLAIISCNKLIYYSAIQYADIPISCYFTQALGILYLAATVKNPFRGFYVFIALLAGFCAATKNEGQAMSLVVTISTLFFSYTVIRKTHPKNFIIQIKNIAPNMLLYGIIWGLIFSPTFYLKKVAEIPHHMFAGNSTILLFEKITSISRYEIIFKYLVLYWPQVGGVLSLLLLLLLIITYGKQSELLGIKTLILSTIFVMLAIYLTVFLVTQVEINNHLRSALDRLLVQLWPLFVSGVLIGIIEKKEPT